MTARGRSVIAPTEGQGGEYGLPRRRWRLAMTEDNKERRMNMEEKTVTTEEILRQNEEAAAKAPVRSVTAGGSTDPEPEDLFLRGFNDGV